MADEDEPNPARFYSFRPGDTIAKLAPRCPRCDAATTCLWSYSGRIIGCHRCTCPMCLHPIDVSDGGGLVSLEQTVGEETLAVQMHESCYQQRPPRGRFNGLGVFDYGYAMTVHKAQGSEWDKVAVLEQIHPDWTDSRWRYTAATRAAKQLHYYLSENEGR